ncbi:MAG: 4Fe-4S binding protein [Candidatus Methanofastidiosia archaeon]
MRNMFIFMLKGAYDNLGRIIFAKDRKTSIQMRNKILAGQVTYPKTVNENACIGCGACANICPVDAIDMELLKKPVKITKSYVKEKHPVFNPLKCMYCFQCHDNCPIFAFYGMPAAIHPRHVGDFDINLTELLQQPIVMKDKKEIDAIVALLDEKAKKLMTEG